MWNREQYFIHLLYVHTDIHQERAKGCVCVWRGGGVAGGREREIERERKKEGEIMQY